MNHLLNVKKRVKAASELVRVTKKGASIFVSVISRIGLLKTILVGFPHEMKCAKVHLETGDHVPCLNGEGFTAAHWFLPEELRELFEAQRVEVLEMAGLEGLSSHHGKEESRLFKDREKWEIRVDVLMKTCTHPLVVGSAEHFLLMGRRQG